MRASARFSEKSRQVIRVLCLDHRDDSLGSEAMSGMAGLRGRVGNDFGAFRGGFEVGSALTARGAWRKDCILFEKQSGTSAEHAIKLVTCLGHCAAVSGLYGDELILTVRGVVVVFCTR